MFYKPKKSIFFLKTTLEKNYFLKKEEKNLIFFLPKEPNSTLLPIYFFWGLKKHNSKQIANALWIVPDSILHQKFFINTPNFYFLAKNKSKFAIYNRKKLLTRNGDYFLPPIEIEPPFSIDSLPYIRSSKHKDSILKRKNGAKNPLSIAKYVYRKLKQLLD